MGEKKMVAQGTIEWLVHQFHIQSFWVRISMLFATDVFGNSMLHHPKKLKIHKIIEDSINYLRYGNE
jgi:hypothetical protein